MRPDEPRTSEPGLGVIDAEQAVIVQARALRAGGLSLRAVAAELDRAGLRARTGKVFAASQVARMVAA